MCVLSLFPNNMETENKDYIINIRVSRETYDKVKQKASENRESISNLVRKVIEDSSEIISDLSRDIFNKGEKFSDIVSYHKAQLAKDMQCGKCGKDILKGETATVGENSKGKRYYFCSECK